MIYSVAIPIVQPVRLSPSGQLGSGSKCNQMARVQAVYGFEGNAVAGHVTADEKIERPRTRSLADRLPQSALAVSPGRRIAINAAT